MLCLSTKPKGASLVLPVRLRQVYDLGNGKGVPYARATLLPSSRDRRGKLVPWACYQLQPISLGACYQPWASNALRPAISARHYPLLAEGKLFPEAAITLVGCSLRKLVVAVVVAAAVISRGKFKWQSRQY